MTLQAGPVSRQSKIYYVLYRLSQSEGIRIVTINKTIVTIDRPDEST